jgi:hypothetical protein
MIEQIYPKQTTGTRVESDSMGKIEMPNQYYDGAQTAVP